MTTKTELLNIARHDSFINSTAKQLNHCSAWYFDIAKNGKGYTVLQSYYTVVALFSHHTGTLYVFNYYSRTTAQHISKFGKLMDCDRITYLYKRSDRTIEYDCRTGNFWKLTSKQFDSLESRDFADYIETF